MNDVPAAFGQPESESLPKSNNSINTPVPQGLHDNLSRRCADAPHRVADVGDQADR
jgi:hypothetical protein